MRKIISFMHMSLDGFVSGPNGELNWAKVDEELFDHIGNRIKNGDTALYGRITYEMMESYWPSAGEKPNAGRHDIEHSKWYSKVHKVVLSRSLRGADLPNTTIISEGIARKINEIKNQQGEEILLFGSPAATHSLIAEDLIDGFWLFVNPIILGQGIPLFNGIKNKMNLRLLPATRQFSNGVTELNYEVLSAE
ncbi:MAG: dihydrofolate reductase family protein [Ignavibacteria bacterium]|nr:dihydrofolate reductase family protein [Ignavibacteria bacterium]